jgi:hypothetical protein
MQGIVKTGLRGIAVSMLLVALAAPSVVADDEQTRIGPPIGLPSQESSPSEEPTFLDLVWIWVTSLAQ